MAFIFPHEYPSYGVPSGIDPMSQEFIFYIKKEDQVTLLEIKHHFIVNFSHQLIQLCKALLEVGSGASESCRRIMKEIENYQPRKDEYFVALEKQIQERHQIILNTTNSSDRVRRYWALQQLMARESSCLQIGGMRWYSDILEEIKLLM